MNLIRRSVSFPENLYEALRSEAFSERISLNKLLIQKIIKKMNKNSVKRVSQDFALFDKIASTGVKYDAVKAVREERDRNEK